MKRIISAIVLSYVLTAPAQDAAPKAIPVYKTYKLRNGKEVAMTGSQWGIANKQWHALSPEDIASLAASITVTIMVEKNDGTTTLGTGFFINRDEVVTNWHVVRDAESITVVSKDGQRAGALLKISKPSMDLATITVPSVVAKNWASFDTDSDWERVGERVYVFGNPQGMEGTFSDGMLSAWRVNGVFMQISAPLDSGSSGSPVINQYGLVIGIVKEQLESTAQLNLAISSNAIYEALELKTDDHPDGFDIGIAHGLEMRTPGEIDADWALENAARIEAENKEKESKGKSADELRSATHDAEIRASNERALKALQQTSARTFDRAQSRSSVEPLPPPTPSQP